MMSVRRIRWTPARVVVAVVLSVGAVAIAWLVVTGLLARREMAHVASDVTRMRAALQQGDLVRVRAIVGDLGRHADSARSYVSGPAWASAAAVPWLGRPASTVRALAAAADELGEHTLPQLVDLTSSIEGGGLVDGASIDLTQLRRTGAEVTRALASLHAVSNTVSGSSTSWLSPVNDARTRFSTALTGANGYLSTADRAIKLAVPMLGGSGVRRYFVGFMNEAESRGLGGLPGAFAILTVDNGRLRFTHFGTDSAFNDVKAKVTLGKDYLDRYGSADPLGVYVNSTIGPDFRDAARIWASLWQTKTGEHIDGAVAIDPTALEYFLRVTGPATSGTTTVTADSVVRLTQQEQYSTFSDNRERKRFLVAVARAVSDRILTAGTDLPGLLKAASRAADERRLMVWTEGPAETELARSSFGGTLDARGAPFSGFTTTNAAGNKLDYYVHRDIAYQRADCDGSVTSTARLSLDNKAPRSGLPSYVTLRQDKPARRTAEGDTSVIVTYYATPGSTVQSVLVDGRSVPVAVGTERGLVTVSMLVELPVQRTRSIVVSLSEPVLTGPVRMLVQPAPHPATVSIGNGACA